MKRRSQKQVEKFAMKDKTFKMAQLHDEEWNLIEEIPVPLTARGGLPQVILWGQEVYTHHTGSDYAKARSVYVKPVTTAT